MFNNVYIETSKEEFLTNSFCYNKEKHALTFPFPSTDKWVTMEDVNCIIKIDSPIVLISVSDI